MRAFTPFNLETLERDPASICALDADLRLAYVNPAWREFGRENGATWDDARWQGVALLTALPSVVRPAYEQLFERAQRTRMTVAHSYECSSPTAFRRFQMRVFPCADGGLVVVLALSHETPHARPMSDAVEALYRAPNGTLTQCSHCRRVRRCDGRREQWDWVPDYVARMPVNTSHGLCRPCVAYCYPDL